MVSYKRQATQQTVRLAQNQEIADICDNDQALKEESKTNAQIIATEISTYVKQDIVFAKDETWKQYRLEKVIAHGTFGLVYIGTNLNTEETVAVKRVYQDTRFKNRELEILMDARDHPYVLQMTDHYYTQGDRPTDTYLHIVTKLYPQTLGQMVSQARRLYQGSVDSRPLLHVPMVAVKMFAWQLLRALGHLHTKGIIHRDVKPQNILVEEDSYNLKLCDFGSAKRIDHNNASVSYICSRYYRAPELIFGATFYNEKIDVWAAACVIAEMIKMTPLFPGKDSKRQICEIFRVMGTPTPDEVTAMNPKYKNKVFPDLVPLPFESNFPAGTPVLALDFLKHLLVYSPTERPTALEVLAHPFFNELRHGRLDLPSNKGPMPLEMFKFTQPEYNTQSRLIEETTLIPQWLPKNWMSHIDRFAKPFHPSQNKDSKNQPVQKKNQVGLSRHQSSHSLAQQAQSKSLSSPTKRRSGRKTTVNSTRTAAGITN